MADPRIVRIYVDRDLKRIAERGEHNFLNRVTAVLKAHGFRVGFHVQTPAERLKSADRPGHALFLMQPPTNARGLTFRKNYIYPFWKIERTAERWTWPVARAPFDPSTAPQPEARRFVRRLRQRLFAEAGTAPTRRDGVVYVPLQGRLLEHRSFQWCSPLDMLDQILSADPARRVLATLHPGETYTRAERAALDTLVRRAPRLEVTDRPMTDLLRHCDYVATQNSSVALSGYFFGKPAALFARIDFHHIAANAHDLGGAEAILRAPGLRPDFDAYLWWFLQDQSINAGHPDANTRIADSLRRAGWLD